MDTLFPMGALVFGALVGGVLLGRFAERWRLKRAKASAEDEAARIRGAAEQEAAHAILAAMDSAAPQSI